MEVFDKMVVYVLLQQRRPASGYFIALAGHPH